MSSIHEDVSNNNKKHRIQSTISFDICIPSKLDSQPYGSVHLDLLKLQNEGK